MQLRRLVVAEAHTFPELGRLFYELGPQSAVDQLAVVLTRLHERGLLDIAEPRLAAADLNWLIMSDAINRAMLLGSDEPPTPREINAWADHAVTVFLAAYRPASGDRLVRSTLASTPQATLSRSQRSTAWSPATADVGRG